jgi:hypothetical protein
MTRFSRLAVPELASALPIGCALIAPSYVHVNAIASDHAGCRETCLLFSGRPGLTTGDLQFRR